MTAALPARSAHKREAIMSSGRELFLAHGYRGTSVDQIAAAASVSKQTVYKHFGDKRELLLAIVAEALDRAVRPFTERLASLAETSDVEGELIGLAGEYLRSVLSDPVVQLRRLVVAEANNVPELSALYYDRAPEETLRVLAETLGALAERGRLVIDEPHVAAEHFAFLTIGKSIDKALFFGGPRTLAEVDADENARRAVRVFLAAYGSR